MILLGSALPLLCLLLQVEQVGVDIELRVLDWNHFCQRTHREPKGVMPIACFLNGCLA